MAQLRSYCRATVAGRRVSSAALQALMRVVAARARMRLEIAANHAALSSSLAPWKCHRPLEVSSSSEGCATRNHPRQGLHSTRCRESVSQQHTLETPGREASGPIVHESNVMLPCEAVAESAHKSLLRDRRTVGFSVRELS
jgi:hypothetical protein